MIKRYRRKQMEELWSEQSKFGSWLEVEIAACEAWARAGKIPKEAVEQIRKKASFSIEEIEEREKVTRHDVVAFLEAVRETVGDEGRYIHLGLTSSDVVDTAQNLRLVRAMDIILAGMKGLIAVLKKHAVKHKETLMVGRTHGVHAEPITLGLKFLLWYQEMRRNLERLERARESVRVGKLSGAVGTFAHTPPEIEESVCELLGLKAAEVSSQVVQRDRYAELIGAIAITGGTIEKITTEIRHLQKTEVLELEEPFGKGQKGSSAMPHKRNPVMCEQLTGLARLLRSYVVPALENIALWHERDISHSSTERIILPDATTLLDYMLERLTYIVKELKINKERMRQNLEVTRGLVFSQKIMLYLIEEKGLDRSQAYGIMQRNAMRCWEEGEEFRELLLKDTEFSKQVSEKELKQLMDYGDFLQHLDAIYGRCGVK